MSSTTTATRVQPRWTFWRRADSGDRSLCPVAASIIVRGGSSDGTRVVIWSTPNGPVRRFDDDLSLYVTCSKEQALALDTFGALDDAPPHWWR